MKVNRSNEQEKGGKVKRSIEDRYPGVNHPKEGSVHRRGGRSRGCRQGGVKGDKCLI